jgi:coiled-coil domain-containing protein 130
MSSLAAARADNFYYPPEWTPAQGSINKFQKSHPLGKRAAKIDQGILVIRFETPYNMWCLQCNNHIGRGVRYNAQKKKVGNYFTTPIWEFTLKCHLCDNAMVIRTNPEKSDYDFVSGCRKKDEDFTAADNETTELATAETKQRLVTDPFYKLEYAEADKRKAKTAAGVMYGTRSAG